jgi:DNA-binding CsgD family transcriptional regulator
VPIAQSIISTKKVKWEEYSSLIEAVYDAALQPAGWTDVAKRFARAFETESCAIFGLNLAEATSGVLGVTENFDAKAIDDYEAYYHTKDLVALRMAQSGAGRAMLSTEVITEGEFRESEIFVDFSRPMRLGFYWAVGSVFSVNQDLKGAIGIHRPRGAPPFDAQDRHNLEALLPHLSRAMLMQRRLEGLTQGNQIVLDALENLSVGMMAVDAQATLLYANPTAERLLHAGGGLACRQGRLAACDPSAQSRLLQMIRDAGMTALGGPGAAGGVISLARPVGRRLSVLVCPLRPYGVNLGPVDPAALLIFGDPDASTSTSTQALMELFGLTPAEARLTAALVDGERLEEYADRLKISVNTARTQSKQVFAKTGCGGQVELVRAILTNPALRARKKFIED